MTKISVKLSLELREALNERAHKPESYDQIIRRLLPFEVSKEKGKEEKKNEKR